MISSTRVRSAFLERPWQLVAAVALSYAVGSYVAFWLFRASTAGAVLFPPAGITLAAFVVTPRKRWPLIVAAIAVTEIAVDVSQGQGFRLALGFAFANTVEPIVGATLLALWWNSRRPTPRLRLIAFFVCAVLVGPAIGALIGAATIVLGQGRGWVDAFFPFWAGDALAVLTVGGALLAWQSQDRDRVAVRVVIGSAAACGLLTVLAFWSRAPSLFYLALPVLMVVALRYGEMVVVAVSGFVIAMAANLATVAGYGPWAPVANRPHHAMASLQLFLAVTVVASWVLTIEINERTGAEHDAQSERVDRQRLQSFQSITEQLAGASRTEAIVEIAVLDAIPLVTKLGVIAVIDSHNPSAMRTWRTLGFPDHLAQPLLSLRTADPVPLAHVARTGLHLALTSLAAIEREFPTAVASCLETNTRSLYVVPIFADGHCLGAIAFGFEQEGPVDQDTAANARAIANLIGPAIDRARLYEHEYHAAHTLQRALLPVIASDLAGVDPLVYYRPAERANEVGGDWYDVFRLPSGRIALVAGDVVGHDIHAATTMGRLQNAVRFLAPTSRGPADLLDRLDTAIDSFPDAFATTMVYAEYDPATRELHYCCAGHLPPLLVNESKAEYLMGARSAPLGLPLTSRPETAIVMPCDAVLVLYTDGLIERRGEPLDDSLSALAAIARSLHPANASQWCERLLSDRTRSVQQDDIVLVCVSFPVPTGAPS